MHRLSAKTCRLGRFCGLLVVRNHASNPVKGRLEAVKVDGLPILPDDFFRKDLFAVVLSGIKLVRIWLEFLSIKLDLLQGRIKAVLNRELFDARRFG